MRVGPEYVAQKLDGGVDKFMSVEAPQSRAGYHLEDGEADRSDDLAVHAVPGG